MIHVQLFGLTLAMQNHTIPVTKTDDLLFTSNTVVQRVEQGKKSDQEDTCNSEKGAAQGPKSVKGLGEGSDMSSEVNIVDTLKSIKDSME